MTAYTSTLVGAEIASLRECWLAYRYGDRDPEVTRRAKRYEAWLSA